ncbi:MAG: hypothetical protein H6R10_1364 [Rhodocyclaceae bacterium]|nr:hypothetical protein [Rhodocyclaceae bacterium]
MVIARDTGDATQPPETATDAEGAARISFKTAIDAHIRWKDRLENYVHGVADMPLVIEVVAADDCCLLGKWIHGNCKTRFSHLEVFQHLLHAHAEFHRHAARILASMQRGEQSEAMEQLQMGDYPKASAEVKGLVAKLYVEVLCDPDRSLGLGGKP